MLKISRSDISSSSLTDYPASSRFIKLPIKPYLELCNLWDTINEPQIALLNAINHPEYRFVVAALARRLGKTYISNIAAQLVELVPSSHVLIISPNYSLSSISFELQRKLITHFDVEVVRDNVKDRVIELVNGSTVRMASVSQVDSAVGRSYDLIIFDEAALCEGGEHAFNVALRPTLDRPHSKCVFISTPRGKLNWFSKFWNRGWDSSYPSWVSIQADYKSNPRMSEADVLEAKSTMSVSEFEQEYCASFTTFEGQIYHFDSSCVVEEVPDHLEYFAGLDPGYRDHTSFVIVGYHSPSDTYYVVWDYLEKAVTTAHHVESWKPVLERYPCESIFIDHSSAQFAADLAYIYDISTVKAKKDVLPGIAFVQNLISHNRLKVLNTCTNVLAMLDSYSWDPNSTNKEKPRHDIHSHTGDAVRYALYSWVV